MPPEIYIILLSVFLISISDVYTIPRLNVTVSIFASYDTIQGHMDDLIFRLVESLRQIGRVKVLASNSNRTAKWLNDTTFIATNRR